MAPVIQYSLVIFGGHRPLSITPVAKECVTTDYFEFKKALNGIKFEGGGLVRNCLADGLAAAAQLLRAADSAEAQKFCILVSNSLPSKETCQYAADEVFDSMDALRVAEQMRLERVMLSVVSPRKVRELEGLFKQAKTPSTEISVPENEIHLCLLAGVKLVLPPVPPDSMGDLSQGGKGDTTQSPPMKKIKVEEPGPGPVGPTPQPAPPRAGPIAGVPVWQPFLSTAF